MGLCEQLQEYVTVKDLILENYILNNLIQSNNIIYTEIKITI
jgi:hypothetical protein